MPRDFATISSPIRTWNRRKLGIRRWEPTCPPRTPHWPHVDFEAGRVRLEAGTIKNDEAREFPPVTQEWRAILEGQKARAAALKKRGIICP
jgi:hypothetical protein